MEMYINGLCEIELVIIFFNCVKVCGVESRRKIINNSLEYCCFIYILFYCEIVKVINFF